MGPGRYRTYVFELDEGGVGLIDATMNPEAVSAKEILVELGKTSEDVRAILFTHGHNDHTAGAFAFPDAELYTLERRIPSIEAAGRRLNILADGERVNLSGTIVEVFHVPGHTNGSTAYLVHNVLFVRDSAGAARRGTIATEPRRAAGKSKGRDPAYCVRTPGPCRGTESVAGLGTKTLRKLRSKLLPDRPAGHRIPWRCRWGRPSRTKMARRS